MAGEAPKAKILFRDDGTADLHGRPDLPTLLGWVLDSLKAFVEHVRGGCSRTPLGDFDISSRRTRRVLVRLWTRVTSLCGLRVMAIPGCIHWPAETPEQKTSGVMMDGVLRTGGESGNFPDTVDDLLSQLSFGWHAQNQTGDLLSRATLRRILRLAEGVWKLTHPGRKPPSWMGEASAPPRSPGLAKHPGLQQKGKWAGERTGQVLRGERAILAFLSNRGLHLGSRGLRRAIHDEACPVKLKGQGRAILADRGELLGWSRDHLDLIDIESHGFGTGEAEGRAIESSRTRRSDRKGSDVTLYSEKLEIKRRRADRHSSGR